MLFSSLVNSVVVATIYAEENGIRERYWEMPISQIFGPQYHFALRDAISYAGSYDQLFAKNFGDVAEDRRGRNMLNDGSSPQIHSFPGLTT